MPPRKTQFLKGNFYHIYNRGSNKENIFRKDENYRFLLQRVKKYTMRDHISTIAYCLMPNHYHFLLRQDSDIPISKFMQAIFNSYTKAFNRMFSRSGTLFEGRFKSVYVDSDEYLIHLCHYIHRNPINSSPPLVKKIDNWEYSNYLEWIGKRNGKLVDNSFIQEHFPNRNMYQEYVLDYKPPKSFSEKLEQYFFD